jgi:hypothetical protein
MKPATHTEEQQLYNDVRRLISKPYEAIGKEEVDTLFFRALRWQRRVNPVVARIVDATLDGAEPATVDDVPGVPTDVFKATRVACFDPSRTVRTFLTSGTTQDLRGSHVFSDLGLYTTAALSAARRWLLPQSTYCGIFLAHTEHEAPESSLTFMLSRFAEQWCPQQDVFCVRDNTLDVARVLDQVHHAVSLQIPVAMLGASFAFVHLFDALREARLALPSGSVVMPTGGFKGRSREIEPEIFHTMIANGLGVTRSQIVGEYGMTELSSQAYEGHAEVKRAGVFCAPPWMLVHTVDPSTLERTRDGEVGLLRILDLANLGSAIAIQTSDLGRCLPQGFEVLGRAPGATPRGCARAMDAALSGVR